MMDDHYGPSMLLGGLLILIVIWKEGAEKKPDSESIV
jgi:hypothetical protein